MNTATITSARPTGPARISACECAPYATAFAGASQSCRSVLCNQWRGHLRQDLVITVWMLRPEIAPPFGRRPPHQEGVFQAVACRK